MIVWGATAYDSLSSLVVIRGPLRAKWYVQVILRPHVLPFLADSSGAIFHKITLLRIQIGFPRTVYVMLPHFLGLSACLICRPSSMCGTKWNASFHHVEVFTFCSVICSNCGKMCHRIIYVICLTLCLTVSPHESGHEAIRRDTNGNCNVYRMSEGNSPAAVLL